MTDNQITSNNPSLANGHFEVSVDGGKTWEIEPNLVVTEGLNYMLDAAFDGGTPIVTFYVALFGGNVTPALGWTGANWVANATEFTNYDEATRQTWSNDAVSGSAIGNSTNPAVFTIATGGGTVRGAALVENATKSSTAGKLIAAARFSTDKVMADDEELRVRYVLSAQNAP
jgi:hypothetical protein